MKDIFKKIVRPLDLREYAPEMEAEIMVWVNPPRSLLTEHYGLKEATRAIQVQLHELAEQSKDPANEVQVKTQAEELGRRLVEIGMAQFAIFAQLWSQGENEALHWSVDEINTLVENGVETDPALWGWMTFRTILMIQEYRVGQKKA